MVGGNPGDKIEIVTKGKRIVGVLMPRPETSEENFITLKLENGYDIGVEKSKIDSSKVLGSQTPKKKRNAKKTKEIPGKPNVTIISTGGTIASKIDYRTGGVNASFTAEDLVADMPEINDIANIKTAAVMNVMSEDMNPPLWIKLANKIAEELNSGSDAVVVTHGTDTMHYSTSAMSFLLENLGKPVVFTGAQRSTDRGSADSFLNLYASISFATGDFSGVFLVMHGDMSDNCCLAHVGTKVRKMHTTRRDAFKSINSICAAKISSEGDVEKIMDGLPKRTDTKAIAHKTLEERVALVKVYPGIDPGIFDYHLGKGIRGVVLEGTALGHVPTNADEYSLIPPIKKLIESGVLVCMTTQCLYGRVNPYVYSNLRRLSSLGVVYLEDMLAETAYVKLMWALDKSKNNDQAKNLMLSNIAGEITVSTCITEKII